MDSVQRGIQAQALLDNEFVREVLNEMDGEYHRAWRAAKTVEAREDCHRYVVVIEKFLSDLQSIVTTGKLEQARRDELTGNTKKGIFAWPTR